MNQMLCKTVPTSNLLMMLLSLLNMGAVEAQSMPSTHSQDACNLHQGTTLTRAGMYHCDASEPALLTNQRTRATGTFRPVWQSLATGPSVRSSVCTFPPMSALIYEMVMLCQAAYMPLSLERRVLLKAHLVIASDDQDHRLDLPDDLLYDFIYCLSGSSCCFHKEVQLMVQALTLNYWHHPAAKSCLLRADPGKSVCRSC